MHSENTDWVATSQISYHDTRTTYPSLVIAICDYVAASWRRSNIRDSSLYRDPSVTSRFPNTVSRQRCITRFCTKKQPLSAPSLAKFSRAAQGTTAVVFCNGNSDYGPTGIIIDSIMKPTSSHVELLLRNRIRYESNIEPWSNAISGKQCMTETTNKIRRDSVHAY